MGNGASPFRDELAAAHARIEALEQEIAQLHQRDSESFQYAGGHYYEHALPRRMKANEVRMLVEELKKILQLKERTVEDTLGMRVHTSSSKSFVAIEVSSDRNSQILRIRAGQESSSWAHVLVRMLAGALVGVMGVFCIVLSQPLTALLLLGGGAFLGLESFMQKVQAPKKRDLLLERLQREVKHSERLLEAREEQLLES